MTHRLKPAHLGPNLGWRTNERSGRPPTGGLGATHSTAMSRRAKWQGRRLWLTGLLTLALLPAGPTLAEDPLDLKPVDGLFRTRKYEEAEAGYRKLAEAGK